MPDNEYAISDLTQANELTNNDLMEVSTVDALSETGYSSVKATLVQIATKILKGIQFASDLFTTDKTIVGAINEVRGVILTDTLTAGSTTLTISDSSILTTSMVDIYTDVYGVSPTSVSVTTGSVTMTFSAQSQNIGVRVVIK